MRPTEIKLNRDAGSLTLTYRRAAGESQSYELSGEFLRVHSPSAEVRGHGQGNAVLQYGKRGCKLVHIEATGNYAITLYFSDGHDSGIYSWHYLKQLCDQHDMLWDKYLHALHLAGKSRESDVQIIRL